MSFLIHNSTRRKALCFGLLTLTALNLVGRAPGGPRSIASTSTPRERESGSVYEKAPPFRTRVLPILTKAGCNAGACHGAATGQGGFKLSLLGYDPEEDFARITREFSGRRIDSNFPEESLFLRKPTQQIDHEGGRRIRRNSPEYQLLVDWIRAGAPYGPPDLYVSGIQVTPADSLRAATNEIVQLKVIAQLSDGTSEDVTSLALYTANDEALAEVSKTGELTTRGKGVTSVMIRYSGQVTAARIAVPFAQNEIQTANFPSQNFIDDYIRTELQRLQISASPPASDSEFLRRVFLDLIGRLPSLGETRSFLAQPGTLSRREMMIDQLLQREEFVDFWTMKLADLLLISGKHGGEAATKAYYRWLRDQIARKTGFDEMTRALLTATGETTKCGPANFLMLANDPRDLAEHVGRIFLGTQIACARCHAHPADRWTQQDYHRFAAYFANLTRDGGVIRASMPGELVNPKTGQPFSPKPLGAPARASRNGADPRLELAQWLTSSENPLFARTIVNRIWKHLLGRGLVEPVDDLRPTNPPTLPALLEALADHFARGGHDLRGLIRTIANSRTYQLTSRTAGLNQLDDRFYSHAYLKELAPQVYVDAVAQVTDLPDHFVGYPSGTRAVQLVDTSSPVYALDVLGRCRRDRVCDGQSTSGGGVAQALHLINGETINAKLHGGRVRQLLSRAAGPREIVEELYLRALTRVPNPGESAEWERVLARAANKEEAIQDLLWVLLNSREFAFNH